MALRDVILRFMPASWRADAMAQTKAWRVQFSGCPHESNLWDVGGLRWKASGSFTTRARCPVCGSVSSAKVARP
jgi:hypothetical protein